MGLVRSAGMVGAAAGAFAAPMLAPQLVANAVTRAASEPVPVPEEKHCLIHLDSKSEECFSTYAPVLRSLGYTNVPDDWTIADDVTYWAQGRNLSPGSGDPVPPGASNGTMVLDSFPEQALATHCTNDPCSTPGNQTATIAGTNCDGGYWEIPLENPLYHSMRATIHKACNKILYFNDSPVCAGTKTSYTSGAPNQEKSVGPSSVECVEYHEV